MKPYRMLHLIWLAALLSAPALAGRPSPAEGDILNYTQVLFQWEQQPDAVAYQLQVAVNDVEEGADPFASPLKVDLIDSTLCAIVADSLDWGNDYVWRVRPLDAEGAAGDWAEERRFRTAAYPSTVPAVYAAIYDSTKYQPGFTMFDPRGTGYTVAVDKHGKPIWFSTIDPDVYQKWRVFSWLPNGNVMAVVWFNASGILGPVYGGWELTINSDIVWEDPAGLNSQLHNEVLKLPNGDYLGLSHLDKNGPIPAGPWTAEFQAAGIDSVIWQGDEVVELDAAGNQVWSWNVWDHFTTADYDSTIFYRSLATGIHDWVHFNALYYDSVEDMIYLSSRSLSRITKVDHKTGDVIWNMGRKMASGEATFGADLKFDMQHAIEMLDNRHLIIFDDGNKNIPEVSRALEIEVTETDTGPTARRVWQYVMPDSLTCNSQGDANRLPNGNTLIAAAMPAQVGVYGHIFEVDPDSNLVWMMKMGSGSMYAAQRIPGMYPQAFCIVQPNLSPVVAQPTIFVPAGSATLNYSLYNEGWLDETYQYQLTDRFGWFDGSGSVDVASGKHATLSFSGTVVMDEYPDKLQLIVTPSQAPARVDTVLLEIYSIASSADGQTGNLPKSFALRQNYPNPFNPETNIAFDLPERSKVDLLIYNIGGQLVRRLVSDSREAGRYIVTWKGEDERGRSLPSGVYFYELRAGDHVSRKRMVLVK